MINAYQSSGSESTLNTGMEKMQERVTTAKKESITSIQICRFGLS
jgi:F0F1-type ATP synthase beta subunit